MYTYIPKGVCSRQIDVELDGDVIRSVRFTGGCNGNLKAVSKLVEGRTVDEVAEVLEGNTCGPRDTSCADQLVCALREAQAVQCGPVFPFSDNQSEREPTPDPIRLGMS